jgi:hypothetical protein
LLGEHPEEIEADLIRYYHKDAIAEYWRGEMSLRQLRVLISHLPLGSAAVTAEIGNDWGSAEYLMRRLIDEFRIYRREFAMTNGVTEAKLGKFEPTEIPGQKNESADEDNRAAEVHQMFKDMRERGKVA